MIFDEFLLIFRFWAVFFFFGGGGSRNREFVMEDFFGGATKYKKITDCRVLCYRAFNSNGNCQKWTKNQVWVWVWFVELYIRQQHQAWHSMNLLFGSMHLLLFANFFVGPQRLFVVKKEACIISCFIEKVECWIWLKSLGKHNLRKLLE
jgi:hypothetical protein